MNKNNERTVRALRALSRWVRKSDKVWDVVYELDWETDSDLSEELTRVADALEKGQLIMTGDTIQPKREEQILPNANDIIAGLRAENTMRRQEIAETRAKVAKIVNNQRAAFISDEAFAQVHGEIEALWQ